MFGNKKGEITMFYLIALVLAVVGFIIVMVLLFSLNLETFQEDEICKLSVLSRATAPELGQGLVPLQCTTKKICITNKFIGKGDCPQFAGEKNVMNVNLRGSVDEKADKISEMLALGLYNCWSQMGEGKLDLFSGRDSSGEVVSEDIFGVESKKNSVCVICSRVGLSEEFKSGNGEEAEIMKKVDMVEYLKNNRPSGSSYTYLQLLTNSQIVSYEKEENYIEFEGDLKDDGKTDEIAFVFMQLLVEKNSLDSALKAGRNTGVILGSSLFLTPVGKLTSAIPGIGAISKAGATLLGAGVAAGISYYNAEKNQDAAAIHCQSFDNSGEKAGCSIVRPFDYNKVGEINEFCGEIEGNP